MIGRDDSVISSPMENVRMRIARFSESFNVIVANFLPSLPFLMIFQGNLEFFANEPIISLHLSVRRF